MFFIACGVPVWAELKIAKGPALSLSGFQIGWHARHAACGGFSAIIVGDSPASRLRLYEGAAAPRIAAGGLPAVPALYEGDDPAALLEALRSVACDRLRAALEPRDD